MPSILNVHIVFFRLEFSCRTLQSQFLLSSTLWTLCCRKTYCYPIAGMNVLVLLVASGRITAERSRCSCTPHNLHVSNGPFNPRTSQAIGKPHTPDRLAPICEQNPVPADVARSIDPKWLRYICCAPVGHVPLQVKAVPRRSMGPPDRVAALARKGATPLRKPIGHRAFCKLNKRCIWRSAPQEFFAPNVAMHMASPSVFHCPLRCISCSFSNL